MPRPERASRPSVPPGSRPATPAVTRPGTTPAGVAVARTTIPSCLVLGGLLLVIGLLRVAAPAGSAWHFGGPTAGWFLVSTGCVAAGCAVILMRFVARRVAATPA